MASARSLLATIAIVALGLSVVPSSAWAAHEVTPARVDGEDRFDTAVNLARLQFPDGAATAVVATGAQFPDALAGTALTGAADAPCCSSVGRGSRGDRDGAGGPRSGEH